MTRWTIQVGVDQLVIEREDDGHVRIEIPTGQSLKASREQVEDIRLKLGAALGDDAAGGRQ